MHFGMRSSIFIALAFQLGCRVNSEPGTTNAPNIPGDRAAPIPVHSGTGIGRARPVDSAGEVTLDWDGPRRLGLWSAELQIFEGAPNTDKAELAISAGGENELRFSFSTQYPEMTPAGMEGLQREYVLTPRNRENLLLFEVPNEPPLITRGSLHIAQIDTGVISGTFDVMLEDARGTRTIAGRFRGPLGISCNVLTTGPNSAARSRAVMNQPGPSWTNVAPNHPFCAQYL